MKKTILAILVAAAMMVTTLYVGADEENLGGVWYVESISQDGQTLDGTTLSAMGMNMVLTLTGAKDTGSNADISERSGNVSYHRCHCKSADQFECVEMMC